MIGNEINGLNLKWPFKMKGRSNMAIKGYNFNKDGNLKQICQLKTKW